MQPEPSTLESLFDIALKLGESQRQTFIDLLKSSQPELGEKLETLLFQCGSLDQLLEDPESLKQLFNAETAALPKPEMNLRKLGPTEATPSDASGKPFPLGVSDPFEPGPEPLFINDYRLLKTLGKGGQGIVYLVRQSEPNRDLALKLLHGGIFQDASNISRFQREYQILSSMNHQHIARIYEVGKDPTGQLFFTMEFVDGTAITDYCIQKNLDLNDRLKLFGQVCRGVQHAHHKLIMHRDLKPHNVLVTEIDGVASVKIIDFGIAKPILNTGEDDAALTQANWMGTPMFMGPEYFSGSIPDIRGDIYALGMLLYQMISDETPFDPKQFEGLAQDEILRIYRLEQPIRPSIRTQNPLLKSGSDDLDWVVMRAISKEADRRYASALELGQDCQNFLDDKPVLAKPPTLAYTLKKFVRRNKALVMLSSFSISLLLVAFVMTLLARNTAETSLRRYLKSFQTLESVLTAPQQLGIDTRVIDLLQTADLDFANDFEDDPQLEASIRTVWGNTYYGLSLYPQARDHLETSVRLLRAQNGKEHAETLRAQYFLARLYAREERFDEAHALFQTTFQAQRKVLGPTPITLETLADMIYLLYQQGLREESQVWVREAESLIKRMPEDVAKAKCFNVLATLQRGKPDRAEAMFRQALAIQQDSLGSDHGNTLATMSNLANALRKHGKYTEAESLYHQIIKIRQRKLGPQHDRTLLAQQGLATCYLNTQSFALAEALIREVCDGFELNKTTGRFLKASLILGTILQKDGQLEVATQLYQKLLPQFERYQPNGTQSLSIRVNLADLLIGQNRFEQAKPLLANALQGMTDRYGGGDRRTVAARVTLGQALEGLGRNRQAEEHYRQAGQALQADHPNALERPYYQAIRAINLTKLKQFAQAEAILLRSLAEAKKPYRVPIRQLLIKHYRMQGKENMAKQIEKERPAP